MVCRNIFFLHRGSAGRLRLALEGPAALEELALKDCDVHWPAEWCFARNRK